MSGIISGPIILFYIFIAYLIYKTILIATQKKILSRVIFALILTFPFWDLMAQKVIKTYYQAFLMEPKIYAMPEFDTDGRVESLGLINIKWEVSDNSLNINKNYYSKYVKDYIELYIFNWKSIDKKEKIKLFLNMNDKKVTFNYIDTSQARYQLVSYPADNKLFGLYQIKQYQMIDTKNKNILGESTSIDFSEKFAYFRENILFLVTGNGIGMYSVWGLGGYGNLMKKLGLKLKG